jgi:hypothetical protein
MRHSDRLVRLFDSLDSFIPGAFGFFFGFVYFFETVGHGLLGFLESFSQRDIGVHPLLVCLRNEFVGLLNYSLPLFFRFGLVVL